MRSVSGTRVSAVCTASHRRPGTHTYMIVEGHDPLQGLPTPMSSPIGAMEEAKSDIATRPGVAAKTCCPNITSASMMARS